MPLNTKNSLSKRLLEIYKVLYKAYGSQHWWPGDTPFEVMVGAILTQNTNWHNAERAIKNIKSAKLLAPEKLLKNRSRIADLIKPSGFYKLKSKRLIDFLKYYVKNYHGSVKNFRKKRTPAIRAELLSVPGIGKETADSILLYALNRRSFVIDAYTRRIFSRHNIVDQNLDYDTLRNIFESNLPENPKIYNEYHALIVKVGKEFCKKHEPLCDNCPLRAISS